MAEAVLDIVAEDPQEQHVAERCNQLPCMNIAVKMVAVLAAGCSREARRDERPLVDEVIAAAELDEEEQHVEADQNEGDDRGRPPLRIVVADREHAGVASLRGPRGAIITKPTAKSIRAACRASMH